MTIAAHSWDAARCFLGNELWDRGPQFLESAAMCRGVLLLTSSGKWIYEPQSMKAPAGGMRALCVAAAPGHAGFHLSAQSSVTQEHLPSLTGGPDFP